jgi:hypothetical protein
MHTRSTPPQSEDGNAILVEPAAGSKPRLDWSQNGETELINFLIEHKAEVGISAIFKPAIWNAISQHLEKSRQKGGPKTSKLCSDKWSRVRRTALDGGMTHSHLVAQG